MDKHPIETLHVELKNTKGQNPGQNLAIIKLFLSKKELDAEKILDAPKFEF